jgi:predicted TIM-barrel fold metal-dependent hydrolase
VPASIRAIDCDIHPDLPGIKPLLPYLDDFWRESIPDRGIESLDTVNYPPGAPLTARADWRGQNGRGGSDLANVQAQALDRWQSSYAICNCLAGVQLVFNEDMARALARAVNDWMAKEWLDRDPRLRASIVVPTINVELAVEEIERCAADRRFVQVLFYVMGEMPLGRRYY